MNKILSLISLIAVIFIIGCQYSGIGIYGAAGHIYMKNRVNAVVTPNEVGNRHGKACAVSIFPFFSVGDASVKSAAQSVHIEKIAIVDHEINSLFFGFYYRFCVHVYGE